MIDGKESFEVFAYVQILLHDTTDEAEARDSELAHRLAGHLEDRLGSTGVDRCAVTYAIVGCKYGEDGDEEEHFALDADMDHLEHLMRTCGELPQPRATASGLSGQKLPWEAIAPGSES